MASKMRMTTKLFMSCPNCGEGEHHCHLKPDQTFGEWSCDKGCGARWQGRIGRDGIPKDLVVRKALPVRPKLVLLRLRRPLDDGTKVFILVEAKDYGHRMGDDSGPFENDQYFYDEHTCPTNFLGDVTVIMECKKEGRDEDPHGIFEWVRSTYPPEGFDENTVDWESIFPEIASATVIDGTATRMLKEDPREGRFLPWTVRTLLCGADVLAALCHNPCVAEALRLEVARGFPLPRDAHPSGFVLGDLHVVCARRYAQGGGRHPVDGIGPGDARLV